MTITGSDSLRRLEDAAVATAQRQKKDAATGSRRRWAKVLAVDEGPPPTVTVEYEPGGIAIGPLRYLDIGLPPAVGDYVMVINVDGDTVVFGRMAVLASNRWAPLYVTINPITADYDLQLSDTLGVVVEHDSPDNHTVTIGSEADVGWISGSTIELCAIGTGQMTVAHTFGSSYLLAPNGSKTLEQGSTIGLRYRFNDKWVVSGDTTP